MEILTLDELRFRHAGHRAAYRTNPVVRSMGSGLDLHLQCKGGARVPVEIDLSPAGYEGEMRATAIIRDRAQTRRAGGRILVEAAVNGGAAESSVGDTGIGIPAAEHAAAFDKFYAEVVQ